MLLQSALVLITLAVGVVGAVTGVAETLAGQIATVSLLTIATGLTLYQQIRSEAAALETRTQLRFLMDAAKPTPEFFNTLKVSAILALKDAGFAFHHLQEDHLDETVAMAFYAEDRTLDYFYLFSGPDLGELLIASAAAQRARVREMLTTPVGPAGWDRRTATRISRILVWWLAKQYKVSLRGHVAMTEKEPRRITEVTMQHPHYEVEGTLLNADSMRELEHLPAAKMYARLVAISGQFLEADHSAAAAEDGAGQASGGPENQ